MKKLIVCIALILSTNLLGAQTNATAQWNQPNILSDAQSYTYTLKVDTATPITLTATCLTVNSIVQCSAPVANWNGAVAHTIILTASNGSASASGTFSTTPGPGVPTGAKVIVIIIGN